MPRTVIPSGSVVGIARLTVIQNQEEELNEVIPPAKEYIIEETGTLTNARAKGIMYTCLGDMSEL